MEVGWGANESAPDLEWREESFGGGELRRKMRGAFLRIPKTGKERKTVLGYPPQDNSPGQKKCSKEGGSFSQQRKRGRSCGALGESQAGAPGGTRRVSTGWFTRVKHPRRVRILGKSQGGQAAARQGVRPGEGSKP